MKVVSVVGARPQFIKAAVVSRAIAKWNEEHPGSVREVLLHTGQHHDVNMSDLFFEQLALPQPGHHLGVSGGTHGEMTGRMLERLEPVLQQESPDWVIVDDHHVKLRAERAGSGDGRVYTILVTCTDGDGNSSSNSVEVTVPHNQ